ncbi:uncharacterized protein SPSK_10491 [Sporothrix schenckii 1099-18]|uniref:Uncharacterized protein n=1 Tax=Sporothrix schenckii 1099-18 TaxID=1397361 RepID=A0A0F2MAR7_SPOSC|nr:uncharacterized protein SPSK_10491 [Sporothrix schenckii 1099-18]KJR86732.1 hypothetical protein SPSK_10491 [Sporothrix schenckii 1099-18]
MKTASQEQDDEKERRHEHTSVRKQRPTGHPELVAKDDTTIQYGHGRARSPPNKTTRTLHNTKAERAEMQAVDRTCDGWTWVGGGEG